MGQWALCVNPIILSNHAVSSGLLSFCDIKQVLQALTSRTFMHSHIRSCESPLFQSAPHYMLRASPTSHAFSLSGNDLPVVCDREPEPYARLHSIAAQNSRCHPPGSSTGRGQRGGPRTRDG